MNTKIENTKDPVKLPNQEVLTQEPKVIEKVVIQEKPVIKYRDRRGGCLNSGIGCNALGCIFILLMLACCASLVFIIINRPAFIWQRVVDHLNYGFSAPDYQPASANYVQENIVSNLKSGQNDIYISEDQLTTIARDKLNQFKDLTFNLENGELTMNWALDNSSEPIFGEIRMKIVNNTIKISKVGTPNFILPEGLNSLIDQLLLSVLNLGSEQGNTNFLSALVNEGGELKINKVEFQKDRLYLDVFININLF